MIFWCDVTHSVPLQYELKLNLYTFDSQRFMESEVSLPLHKSLPLIPVLSQIQSTLPTLYL